MNLTPLYHWSPAERSAEILRHGLRPACAPTVASSALPYLCLGTNPQTAWSISGAMDWVSEVDEWDLWLVHLEEHDELRVRHDFGPRIFEVKVYTPLPVDRLWWIGRRDTTGPHAVNVSTDTQTSCNLPN